MSSEGDIFTSSAGEVTIVQADVLEIVMIALTVLLDAPVHLTLHCRKTVSGQCLQSGMEMGWSASFLFALHCNFCGDVQLYLQ